MDGFGNNIVETAVRIGTLEDLRLRGLVQDHGEVKNGRMIKTDGHRDLVIEARRGWEGERRGLSVFGRGVRQELESWNQGGIFLMIAMELI